MAPLSMDKMAAWVTLTIVIILYWQGVVGQVTSSVSVEPTPSALSTPKVTSVCSCLCNSAAVNRPTSAEEVSAVAEEHKNAVKGQLILDTKNLSATINKKESAADKRPSSTYMGFLGIFMLSFVIGSMVLLDVPRLVDFLKSLKTKKSKENETGSTEEIFLKQD